jgi:hypothetical protein
MTMHSSGSRSSRMYLSQLFVGINEGEALRITLSIPVDDRKKNRT